MGAGTLPMPSRAEHSGEWSYPEDFADAAL